MAHPGITTSFFISNLHCPSCVTSIETSLSTLKPQPISVSHSIISHSVTVRHHDTVSAATITGTLEQAGFEVYSVVQGQSDGTSSWQLERTSSPNGWGLEQAVERWTQSRKDANANVEENRKRKRHMDQCKQCQEEMNSSGPSSDALIGKESRLATYESLDSLNNMSDSDEDGGALVVVDSEEPRLFQASFSVSGMTCSACVGNVSSVVLQHAWVEDVNVVLLSNSATVTFRGKGNETKIANSVEDAGYDISLENLEEVTESKRKKPSAKDDDVWRATYSIGGMTCSACVGAITNGLREQNWIDSVDVNLISNSATVVFHGKERGDKIKEMIEDLGYDASLEEIHDLSADLAVPSEREVIICVEGMYCHHCPARIVQALSNTYGSSVEIKRPLTESDPLLRIAYKPQVPDFTLRHIITTTKAVDEAIEASIYHHPTIEERSQEIHSKERRRILKRLALSVIIAIPTFIIGIVYMSLVKSQTPARRYFMKPVWAGSVSRAEWSLFIMSSIVYFLAADIFHMRTISGIRALWRRSSPVPILQRFYRFGSMNMLITIGTSIAYFASIAALAMNATQSPSSSEVEGTTYYFDSVVFLTMFLLMGRFLEAYSKAKTSDAVASLGLLRPSEAILVSCQTPENSEDAKAAEEKISVDFLEIGDMVRVPHGTSPPFDGVIATGTTKMDEASLTGEARLISKSPGDQVFSGTINKGNPITIRLTSISGTSMLDQIIRVVREGQTRRAPVERVADVITSHFVPFIVVVGILTWVVWLALGLSKALPDDYLDSSTGGWPFWSLQFAIAVFVIACPCGIGLASPTALFVGGGIAAKEGILVKGGGEAFQEASMLDCVVFDKTGTLTAGTEPVVTANVIVGGADAEKTTAVGIARSLEENSGHPIATAIVSFCVASGAKGFKTSGVEEIPGKGLKGRVFTNGEEEVTAIVGNEALMEDYAVDVDTESAKIINDWKRQGMSIALLATKGSSSIGFTLSAAFAISDPIRPEAASVIRTLQDRGLSVWLLSGDNQITANSVGAAVGIPATNVIAGVLPEQKAEKIKYLQRTLPARKARGGCFSQRVSNSRATVAMVGDGINDAPALATADVGIAIGSGSDVALSTASFVLVKSDLNALVTLITLSRAVFRRIWFNFGWALVYNLVALPVAAGVLYPIKSNGAHVRLDPVWASLAMALSSVSVVTSSLALRTRIPGIGFRSARRTE